MQTLATTEPKPGLLAVGGTATKALPAKVIVSDIKPLFTAPPLAAAALATADPARSNTHIPTRIRNLSSIDILSFLLGFANPTTIDDTLLSE
ncbi:MAG: hypothetical protein M3083_04770 [Actinomycetota bacterium]|nr:hypothetical protein [Actinomycetota bacterium]MDQ6910168.1 hypothetical protein [Actinomycetota bacterium]MDQ6946732.1 hypothetical protein [Actinomycetota bacterium]